MDGWIGHDIKTSPPSAPLPLGAALDARLGVGGEQALGVIAFENGVPEVEYPEGRGAAGETAAKAFWIRY
jgi:hypothetical protein